MKPNKSIQARAHAATFLLLFVASFLAVLAPSGAAFVPPTSTANQTVTTDSHGVLIAPSNFFSTNATALGSNLNLGPLARLTPSGTANTNTYLKYDGTNVTVAVPAGGSGGEPALGNPSVNGYVLSSSTNGIRSWVVQSGGGGGGGSGDSLATPAIVSGALTLNLSAANHFAVSLNADITTMTISNPGTANTFWLRLTADGTARAITWPASVYFAKGVSPSLASNSGQVNVIAFNSFDGGSTYQGTPVYLPVPILQVTAPTTGGVLSYTWDLRAQGPLVLSTSGNFTITPGTTFTAHCKLWGAGGSGGNGGTGGGGGYTEASVSLSGGVTYNVWVGEGGKWRIDNTGPNYAAFGGGGANGTGGGASGGGGGMSAIFAGSAYQTNAILVAGGGGASGYTGGAAGAGGGTNGGLGQATTAASQTAAGTPLGGAGALQGGTSSSFGAGGGGYWGGGYSGSSYYGGGGGSGYAYSSASSVTMTGGTNTTPGNSTDTTLSSLGGTFAQGSSATANGGTGVISISY